jgi:DNA-binding CsgD family transcriptional regulator/PAS domain-containing protein
MQHVLGLEFVVSRVYDAVSEQQRWEHAMKAAERLFVADAVLLLYSNLSAGGLEVIAAAGFDREALEGYVADALDENELIRESMDGPAGIVVSSAATSWRRQFRSTRLYRRLLAPSDLFHIAGAAALNTAKVYASLWMARSDRSPDFSVHNLRAFRELLPHVARAMTVHHRVRHAELEARMAAGALDRVAVGVVLLDVRGAPVMVNREANRIIGLSDGFALIDDGPVAAISGETRALRELISQVGCDVSPMEGEKRAGGAAIRLTRPSGRSDYHVVVMPLPTASEPGTARGAVAVVFITDPEETQSPVDSLFGDLYSLTRAETRLVSRLLEGGGLTAASEKLGLSRNTVHSQLASIFQKTGTRRQSELLRLLLGGIAPVSNPDLASGAEPTMFRHGDLED